MDNSQLEHELSNNLSTIKNALTLVSSSLEGIDAQAVLNVTRAYNETVKTLLEVRKKSDPSVPSEKKSLPSSSSGILQINFNDIIKSQDQDLPSPVIDVEAL